MWRRIVFPLAFVIQLFWMEPLPQQQWGSFTTTNNNGGRKYVTIVTAAQVQQDGSSFSSSSSSSSSSTGTQNASPNVTTTAELRTILKHYIGTRRRIQHDGLVRWFMEYPPPKTTASVNDSTIPVLILLHFGTGNMRSSGLLGRTLEKDPWLRLSEQFGFVILSPSAVAPRRFQRNGYNTRPFLGDWNDFLGGRNKAVADVDDVGFIEALVQWAINERNGDPKRVYIYGFSNGGMMVQRMIIERPNLFAAAASVVANLPETTVPIPSSGTPLFLMCSTEDDRIPYLGGDADANRGRVRSAEATRDFFVTANQAGPNMTETTLPDLDPNDNCRIISQFYPSNNATPVQYYILDGGGHNFAGQKQTIGGYPIPKPILFILDRFLLGNSCNDADGIQLAWDFMSQFTLPSSK